MSSLAMPLRNRRLYNSRELTATFSSLAAISLPIFFALKRWLFAPGKRTINTLPEAALATAASRHKQSKGILTTAIAFTISKGLR